MKKFKSPLSALVLSLALLTGCGGYTNNPNPGPTGYDLKPNTKVITPTSSLQVASRSGDTVVLNQAADFKPGDVLLNENGEGMLLKVLSSSTSGGRTTLQTSQASLTDAISRLDPNAGVPLNEANAGPITAEDPSVQTSWTSWDGSGKQDVVRLTFGANGSPTRVGNANYGLVGTLEFQPNTVYNPIIVTDASGSSVLKSLELGIRPEVRGKVQIIQSYSGSFDQENVIVNKDFKSFPIPGTPLRITPNLKVISRGQGSANFALDASLECNAEANLSYKWEAGSWSPVATTSVSLTPLVASAKGTFEYDIKPLEVLLTLKAFGIAGPQLGMSVGSEGTGVLAVSTDGQDVIRASVKSGLFGTVGLKGDDKLVALLDEVLSEFGAGETPTIRKDFHIAGPEFNKDFPLGASDIEVGDDGPAPDDVFDVFLDGNHLGTTTKGGTGKFRVSDLAPGSYSLKITCLDDGANGSDTGTLGIMLLNGLTFGNGSSNYSTDLELGQSVTLQLVVPQNRSRTSSQATFPMMKSGRKGR